MMSRLTGLKAENRKEILWILAYLVMYILIGISLGVMPVGQMMTNGLMYNFIGLSDAQKLDSIFQITDPSCWIPYGMSLTESFGVVWFERFIALTGINGLLVVQIELFLFFTAGYVCMLKVMNAIAGNRIAGIVLTMVYFWNPVMIAQQGIPTMYMGILFIPVVILVLFRFNQYIEVKLNSGQYQITITKQDIYYVIINFLCFLILSFTSWYLAVIAACATCLYYLIYLLFCVRKTAFYKLVVNYIEYMLFPWIIALGINLLMTPSSVASTTTAFNFMNGNSIDVITMLLPSTSQFIGRFFSVEKMLSTDRYIPGNGVMFYLGYTIIILIVMSVVFKKSRNKINLSVLFAGIVLFIISLGPGLRVGAILDKEMLSELGQYRLPLEENVIQFPWGFLFEKFPLNIMRAVYRWYIGAVALFLVLTARTLGSVFKEGKKGRVTVYIICAVMFVEFVPRIDNMIAQKTNNYDTYQQAYMDCIEELKGVFEREENTVVFCSYDYNDNTYMVPCIMREYENCVTYSGAGDKARGMAKPYVPQCVYDFMHGTDPESLAINVTKMSEYQLADYVILPYYDLSNAVYTWPMSSEIVDRTRDIAEQVAGMLEDKYRIIRLDHYMVIELEEGNASEKTDILADRESDNAKYFLTDEGFGTKYAIELEGQRYTQGVFNGDDTLYIYCVTKAEMAGQTELCIEYKDKDGVLLDTDTHLITESEEYTLAELEVSLPDDTDFVECYFSDGDAGKTYLKKLFMTTYHSENIRKSDEITELEQLLGLTVKSAENVEIEGDIIALSENTKIILDDKPEAGGNYVKIKMDICLSNENDVEIINKWVGWGKYMTFAFAYHGSDKIYFLNVSDDGEKATNISWGEEQMPRNEWNTLEMSFENGVLKVEINGNVVGETECEFTNLYVSNQPVTIGSGIIGKIKNFEYEQR